MNVLKKLIVVIFLTVFVYSLMALVWFNYVAKLEHPADLYKGDVAVVLMGEVNKDFTDIGDQTTRRLNFALELKKLDMFDKFLCVGGLRAAKNFSGAQLMKEYLIKQGINPNNVLVEVQSYDTRTNLKFSSEIIKKNNWDKVILLSSPLHIHRIRKLKELNYLKEFDVQFATFLYDQAVPEMTMFEYLRHTHYEWMSYFVGMLPEKMYQKIVRHVREQD